MKARLKRRGMTRSIQSHRFTSFAYLLTIQIKALEDKSGMKADDGPRVFILHKYACSSPLIPLLTIHRDIYQMRVNRVRQIEAAKRQAARVKDPQFFPATPKGELS